MKKPAFCLLVVLFSSCSHQDTSFEKVLSAHLQHYPKMEVCDVYKLVYQAAMGNEHIMTDTVSARRYLQEEVNAIDTSTVEPMFDPLSPDDEWVRLNLRPYKTAHGNMADLFQAMMISSRWSRKSETRLERWWQEIEELAQKGTIPYASDSLRHFFARMKAEHFPPVHHSNAYVKSYAPSYRVIVKRFFITRAFVFHGEGS